MSDDAIQHLKSAASALTLEAYRGRDLLGSGMTYVEHFTIAEELDRIDCALGPKGESMFAHMADRIREAYVEILAARAALKEQGQ